MANADVYTQAGTQNVRCLVSINFGSTRWLLRATSRISLFLSHLFPFFFFFIGPYVCRASRPRAHLSARNLPLRVAI